MGEVEAPTALQLLRASSLLISLTEGELFELAGTSKVVRFERGEVLWLVGSEVDFFGIVGTGFVKMVRSRCTGADATLELMGPGQVFGLLGAIEGTGCPLAAVAATTGSLVKVQKHVFMPMYRENTPMKDLLLRRTTTRFQNSHNLLSHLLTGTVEQRIATILLTLCETYGEQSTDGFKLCVPLTRNEIGEMIGSTVESTIRTLSRWQKEGIVATDHHFLTIKDERRLRAVLGDGLSSRLL